MRALGLASGVLLVVWCHHLVVEVSAHLSQFLVATCLLVADEVGLSATLVVGITGVDAIAWRPLMERGPAVCIVDIALVLVYLIERHQSFVIDGTCPETRWPDLLDVGRNGRVAVFRHKVVVYFASNTEYIISCYVLGRHR